MDYISYIFCLYKSGLFTTNAFIALCTYGKVNNVGWIMSCIMTEL